VALTEGTRLGPYEILGKLGAGGMGEVYLARDLRLARDVALKVLPQQVAADPEAVARLRREALTLASLTHPNIAAIYGFEESQDGPLVLALERVEGETLASRIAREALPTEMALHVCAQIAQALEAAHERGVIHRDVKPANVMIGPRGLVKVLDFGLARRSLDPLPFKSAPAISSSPQAALANADTMAVARSPGSSDTVSSPDLIVGTPGYMSPEQILASDVDERSDVFAFGCVLYECLTGQRAFQGGDTLETLHAALERSPDLSVLPARVPARVRLLLQRCLERKPAERLASIRLARIELEEALGIRRVSAMREGEIYSTPNNLPARTTSFIGRTHLLEECRRALGASRLLTLAGMGGTGKTRVAIHLAGSLLAEYPDGVWFVDLSALADSRRVVDLAAEILGVADEPGFTSLQSLVRHIRDRRMLFVLDNCEEVLEGAVELTSALLKDCPATRVLATSRQALRVEGESVLAVPPLAVPQNAHTEPVEALRDYEAVALFVDRAIAVQPSFALDPANAPSVAEICRRLDGIPLAIELAASRIRMLDAGQIRERLHDRFKLLARPGADVPSRQQTVKSVIQWSWDHLLPPEQDLMRRLAVFTGGWTLQRATAVCSDSGDEFEVLDLLTRLVEHSLVVVDRGASGRTRYRFLESVWRFALEKLEAHAELALLQERHLATYFDFARRAETAFQGPEVAQQIVEVAAEEENLLAALAFTEHAVDGAKRGLELVTSLRSFWSISGRYTLGHRVFHMVLNRPGAKAASPERAWALVRASAYSLFLGDPELARQELEESLAFWRSAAPSDVPAAAIAGLGVVAIWQSRFEEALTLAEEALEIYQKKGQTRGVAMVLHNLGTIEWALGRPDHGRARLEKALALFREVKDPNTETLCLAGLVSALVRVGEIEEARKRASEGLDLLEIVGSPRERVFTLDAVAELAMALGRSTEAARLFGAAQAERAALTLPLNPAEKADLERLGAILEEAMGVPAADRARAEGKKLSLERILAEARSVLHAAHD
jgi:non-specific serine/threonine protein kinase